MYVNLIQAIEFLNTGKVVALPTETVYGLAASLKFPDAIKQIFTLKGRPQDNPLIVHTASMDQLTKYTDHLPEKFESLAELFWPGSLTLVAPANPLKVPRLVRAGLPTVAFRIPQHSLTLQVLQKTGPLVMPSANLSGRPSATLPGHVENDFGQSFPVVDGGPCSQGLESTILIYSGGRWVIGRQGGIALKQFEPVLGYIPEKALASKKPLCPGQLYQHYSPQARLQTGQEPTCEAIVGFSDRVYPSSTVLYSLGKSDQPKEAAHRLYQVLRSLDQEKVQEAWIDMEFPQEGLWLTIRERLLKAIG